MLNYGVLILITWLAVVILGSFFAGVILAPETPMGWTTINGKNCIEYHDSLWTLKPLEFEE